MSRQLGALPVEAFLAEYWQRAPCLLRGALADVDFPLDGDDLAGLACEPLAEARLISGPDRTGCWTLRHGPFDERDFDGLGDANWTLLVQDVEKHYPPLADLLERFDFLPRWRVDDLMVSFAAPGGSVGPHVDQYDVFLCQVQGRRRWELASDFEPARREDVPLDMLAHFETDTRWDLEPGDVLYLPPGVAHHGVALDPCLTCSVGFRAPSAADLALALGEWLADRDDSGGRYRDPGLRPAPPDGEIDAAALERFRTLLRAQIDGPAFGQFLGAFMSRFRQAHEPAPGPGPGPQLAATDSALTADVGTGALTVHPWARLAWIREGTDRARLFASGRAYVCSVALAAWLGAGAQGTPPTLAPGDRRCLQALIDAGQLLQDA